MNHKLVESYIKDQLRKFFGSNKVFCEYSMAYIGTYAEITFGPERIYLYGYKSNTELLLKYPTKDDQLENKLETIISVILALYNLEASYDLYKEVI
nr:MAG TPA: hypothetical protein [Caudoviricetes sp.]